MLEVVVKFRASLFTNVVLHTRTHPDTQRQERYMIVE